MPLFFFLGYHNLVYLVSRTTGKTYEYIQISECLEVNQFLLRCIDLVKRSYTVHKMYLPVCHLYESDTIKVSGQIHEVATK